VQAIIEADASISAALTLLRNRGSVVTLGRLRILPTDSSILYIEPLFLSAEDNAIPQLERVIVSDGTGVSMAEDLGTAVAALVGSSGTPRLVTAGDTVQTPADASDWMRSAIELMRTADERLRAGDFAGFGTAWNQLRALLERQSGGARTP
jgi:uncharacterized membrane protein (UPF0182 family)